MTTAPGSQPLLDDGWVLPVDRPFTTRMARDAGVSARALTELTAQGYLRRMVKGVYVAAQVADSVPLRAHALRLVVPPDCVVTDRIAGWLHSAATLAPGDHLDVPKVTVFRAPGNPRLRNGLVVSGERALLPGDVMELDGIVVTTPLRTAWDLGRMLHRDQAIGALDALLRLGRFSRDELLDGVERFRRQRGVVRLRELAPLADPRAESPGESTLRLRWLDTGGMPPPEPQLRVAGPSCTYRLDIGAEKLRFAAEYDGEEHHSAEADRARDRRRRAWIEREHRFVIKVFRRADVFDPRADACRVLAEGVLEARRALGTRRPWL